MSEYERQDAGLAYEPTDQDFGSGAELGVRRVLRISSGKSRRPATG